MVEASDEYDIDGDQRNRRGADKDAKKRLNHKEQSKRHDQIQKRNVQREGTEQNAEDLKQEFDEINEAYLKRIEKKQKGDEEAKRNEEKKSLFDKDFVQLALGPEPKQENKKKIYEEKVQGLVASKTNKKLQSLKVNPNQRSALLNFMKQQFN